MLLISIYELYSNVNYIYLVLSLVEINVVHLFTILDNP